MATEAQNACLSLLRKQKPRLLDGPGLRINFGMTARRAADGKTYEVLTTFYAKQTQFPKSPNECKLTYNKGLQKKRRFLSPKKQTQFKPNQTQGSILTTKNQQTFD